MDDQKYVSNGWTVKVATSGNPQETPLEVSWGFPKHTGRNCFNLFQILFSANTADTDPGVSGLSKDQNFYEKFKNTHCQVDHPGKIE